MELQVGVKIFLINEYGKYLTIKRSPVKYPGIKGAWDIVGGRIEKGTSLIDNLRREVREETRLVITSEPQLIFAQDILRGNDRHVVRLSYVGKTEGEPVLDLSENVEYQWLTFAELKQQHDLDFYVNEVITSGIMDSHI